MLLIKKMSLRQKAIAFGLALGTIPLLTGGIIIYQLFSNNIKNTEITNQEIQVFSIEKKINAFMIERYGDIQIIANLSILNDLKNSADISKSEKERVLNRFVEVYKTYENIHVFDLNGNNILSSSGKTVPNHKKSFYFKEVIQTNNVVITEPKKSDINSEFFINIAAPIKEINTGKIIGVVKAKMPVKSFDNLLSDYENKGYEWHLIRNRDNKFFAALEKNHVDRDAQENFPILNKLKSVNKANSGIIVDKIHGAEQLITYTAFSKYENLPQLDWGVIIARDTKDVFAPANQLFWTIASVTGITAIVAGGIGILLANRTTKLLKNIANAIASSSNEIATTVEQQERTISLQSSSVNETTTTMDELSASSRQSAEQAEASAAGARKALILAEDGTRAVQQTMQGMSTLKEKVHAIAEQIVNLSEQTGQIGSISDLVSDIANQTNMLSLNAAVEAARAGEQGKGFGVVASEIRQLADRSKKSAEKITNLVADIQAAINTTVMVTDEGTKTVDRGIQLAQGTSDSFVGLADAINNVFLNSQQISLSAKQQANAVNQVLSAMNSINLGTRESATGMTQVKTSTVQLNGAAQQLKEIV
jgi:methyl-accepting chemotaxis protein